MPIAVLVPLPPYRALRLFHLLRHLPIACPTVMPSMALFFTISLAFFGSYLRTTSISGVFGSAFNTADAPPRSEEHTSELQSRENLVCRLLLVKKNTRISSVSSLA